MASLARQLTSFFQSMFNRMVARAAADNPADKGHIGSSPNQSTSGDLGGGSIPIGNIAVYGDPKTERYIKDGYSGNSTIYTIISRTAKKFGYIPRSVYQIKDPAAAKQYKHFIRGMDGKVQGNYRKAKELFIKAYDETVVQNKLSQLLLRPNPEDGQDSFLVKVCIYYETAGEAIVWCNRGADGDGLPLIDGEILEMWVLPPQYMEIVPDPYNVWGGLGWVFNVAGKRLPIDKDNIIHWKNPNINFDGVSREHMRGMSALRPGNKKVTEDESATDASVALNQNQGSRALVFDKSTSKMTPERETSLRGVVDRKINNSDMRGAVAVVQGDFGVVDLSMSSVDMELETRKDNIFDRLCNLLGVPPDLFKTGQTYQNILQARKDFITDKVLPLCCSFRDELNRVVLPAFKLSVASYTTDVDTTQIIELQDDNAQKVTALAAAWWITPNEKRKECDLEESDEDGMDDIWLPNTIVKMEDAGMPMDEGGQFNDPETNPSAAPKKNKNNSGGKVSD